MAGRAEGTARNNHGKMARGAGDKQPAAYLALRLACQGAAAVAVVTAILAVAHVAAHAATHGILLAAKLVTAYSIVRRVRRWRNITSFTSFASGTLLAATAGHRAGLAQAAGYMSPRRGLRG